MYRKIIFLLLVVNVAGCSTDKDFDKVCGYFGKLEIEISNRHLSNIERADFISGFVNRELKSDSNAKLAWELVSNNAVPEDRYELYKTSAESITKKKWQCKAMEKLFPTTGD